MDDKADRRNGMQRNKRRRTGKQSYGRMVWRSLQTHKNVVFTGTMLLLLVVLLVGIVSQLQPPSPNTTPTGQTAIEYSVFVQQVKEGNVLAASIRGDEVSGLLAQPLVVGKTLVGA